LNLVNILVRLAHIHTHEPEHDPIAMCDAASRVKERDWSGAKIFSANAKSYALLVTKHIYKEDNILSQVEKEELVKRFELLEKQDMGEGVHKKYIRPIEELEHKVI